MLRTRRAERPRPTTGDVMLPFQNERRARIRPVLKGHPPLQRRRGRNVTIGGSVTLLVTILALCLTVLLAPRAKAQSPDSLRQEALRDFHGPDLKGKDGPLAKAGLDLLFLYHTYRAQGTDGVRSSELGDSAMQIHDGRVTIDAIASGDASTLQADLEKLGLTNAASVGRLVSGRFPIKKIPELAALSTLRGVQPSRAQTRSTTQRPPSNQEALARQSTEQNRTDRDTASSPDDTSAAAPPDTAEAPTNDAPAPAPPETDPTTQQDTASASARTDSGANWNRMIVIGGLVLLGGLLVYLWKSRA